MKEVYLKSKSGFKWTFVSNVVRGFLNFGTALLLTYYLGAEKVGLVSILTVIYGLSQTLVHFGISQSIIRRNEISHDELTTIFWMNAALGLAMFAIVYLSSSRIAGFYHEPVLSTYIKALSVIFLLSSLDLVFRAFLEKNLRFAESEIINMIENIVLTAAVAVFLMLGFGVVSYVYALILSAFVSVFSFFIFFLKEGSWFPRFHFSLQTARSHISFGAYITGKSFLNYAGRNFDELIVGKVLGFQALGIYYLAKRLIENPRTLFTNAISTVVFPMFSKLQTDIDRLRKAYLNTTHIISVIGYTIYGVALVLMAEVVRIFFGVEWAAAVPILRVFCLVSIVSLSFIDSLSTSLLYVFGKANYAFWIDLIVTPLRLLLLYFAATHSLIAVSLVFLAVVATKSLVIQSEVDRLLQIRMSEYLRTLLIPIQNLIASLLVAYLVYFGWNELFRSASQYSVYVAVIALLAVFSGLIYRRERILLISFADSVLVSIRAKI